MTVSEDPAVPGAREGIEQADRMIEELAQFTAELKKLSRRDKRSRLFLRILAVTFLVDICITVGLGITSVQTRENSRAIHQSQIAGCQQNNGRLARQEAAIDSILKPTANVPAAQRAAAEAYFKAAQAKISGGWAPRNCISAYKLP